MADRILHGPGSGFLIWTPDSNGRLGVVRLGRLVAVPAFTNPNFLSRLAREAD